MAKRLIDGDALWMSSKLENVPAKYRAEYAWILPLAEANGCCEYNPTIIWGRCYAQRPGWNAKKVAEMFDAFVAAKMIFRFKNEAERKTYCFFIGMESRLPSVSERNRYKNNKNVVPLNDLADFLQESVESVSSRYQEIVVLGKEEVRKRIEVGEDRTECATHNPSSAPLSLLETKTKTTTTATAKTTATATTTTDASHPPLSPFDPLTYSVETVSKSGIRYSPEQVHRLLVFHFTREDEFWKTRVNSVKALAASIDSMAQQVPSDWQVPVPKKPRQRVVGDPACRKCRGKGYVIRQSTASVEMIRSACDCAKREQVHINNEWKDVPQS